MDGFELAERARRARPGLRILYTSGFFMERPRRRETAPDGAMLPKPWLLAQLNEAVKRPIE